MVVRQRHVRLMIVNGASEYAMRCNRFRSVNVRRSSFAIIKIDQISKRLTFWASVSTRWKVFCRELAVR